LHETYIISQTPDSIIITDQHAAHERLTYEKLKAEIANGPVHTQRLLMPEIIELPDEKRGNLLLEKSSELAKYGLIIEVFSTKSVIVTEVPQIIGNSNIGQLINDIADDLLELGEDASLTMLMEHVLETYACHHSIRAGRKLSIVEMNHLLRDMESTAFSGQCNHGRPTYITLKLKDVEKLFGRT
jgi:DNA mismatch repair protein MutL